MSITGMIKEYSVRIKLPKQFSKYIQLVRGRENIALVKLLEHNDIFIQTKITLLLIVTPFI